MQLTINMDSMKEPEATAVPSTIAIDGPAAAGKSTAGRRLAAALDYLYLDTGAMYRAVTLLALERGIATDNAGRLGELATSTRIDVVPPDGEDDGRHYTVRVGERDITWAIRRPQVDAHVSEVSAHTPVRAALTEQQRRIGNAGSVVMVGRDIGTVVMPEAGLKVYLDASLEERARRRHAESVRQGRDVAYEEILAAMRARDHHDSTRKTSPLRQATDAVYIDTSTLSLDEVVVRLLRLAHAAVVI